MELRVTSNAWVPHDPHKSQNRAPIGHLSPLPTSTSGQPSPATSAGPQLAASNPDEHFPWPESTVAPPVASSEATSVPSSGFRFSIRRVLPFSLPSTQQTNVVGELSASITTNNAHHHLQPRLVTYNINSKANRTTNEQLSPAQITIITATTKFRQPLSHRSAALCFLPSSPGIRTRDSRLCLSTIDHHHRL
uniref:Uncharacterized protein n=1 Tax=Lactuca sativa TaxID=4236 RepID=A0A9R1VBR7_LACSA|nr:hypothetical protein LSAT_V11C500279950 [Lactuca sativa]